MKNKKIVRFDSNVKILHMHVWLFAYREARTSDCAKIAADRYRFGLRKEKMEAMLAKINFFSRR